MKNQIVNPVKSGTDKLSVPAGEIPSAIAATAANINDFEINEVCSNTILSGLRADPGK